MSWVFSIFIVVALHGCVSSRTPDTSDAADHRPSTELNRINHHIWAGSPPLNPPANLRWAYDGVENIVEGLEPDQRLAQASEILLDVMEREGRSPTRLERSRALRDAGLAEPVPVMVVISAPVLDQQQFLSLIRERLERHCRGVQCNRVGLAIEQQSDTYCFMLLAMGSQLTMDPVPHRIDSDVELTLRGEVHTSADVEVLVSLPSGQVRTLAESHERAFNVAFLPEERGPHRFEVVGRINGSPTVVGLFDVIVGQEAGEAETLGYRTPAGRTTDPILAKTRILELVNAARREASLSELTIHDELGQTAQDYAETMLAEGFFGHVDPQGRNPSDRVRSSGILVSVVRENLAIASSAEEAHATLRESPIHWRATLDERTTHAGVGVARGPDGGLRVVILMTRMMPPFDPERAAQEVLGAIAEARRERNLPSLHIEVAIQAAATAAAERLSQPEGTYEGAREAALSSLRSSGISSLTAVMFNTGELNDIAEVEQILDPSVDRAGVAVRLAQNRSIGYYVVVLLGH